MVDSTGCVDAGRRMGRAGRRERPMGRLDDVLAEDDRGVRRVPDQSGAAQLVESTIFYGIVGGGAPVMSLAPERRSTRPVIRISVTVTTSIIVASAFTAGVTPKRTAE